MKKLKTYSQINHFINIKLLVLANYSKSYPLSVTINLNSLKK